MYCAVEGNIQCKCTCIIPHCRNESSVALSSLSLSLSLSLSPPPSLYRETGPRCPVDNTRVSNHQLFKDNFAKREVLSLNVRCSADDAGCKWQGELRDLEVYYWCPVCSLHLHAAVMPACSGTSVKDL